MNHCYRGPEPRQRADISMRKKRLLCTQNTPSKIPGKITAMTTSRGTPKAAPTPFTTIPHGCHNSHLLQPLLRMSGHTQRSHWSVVRIFLHTLRSTALFGQCRGDLRIGTPLFQGGQKVGFRDNIDPRFGPESLLEARMESELRKF